MHSLPTTGNPPPSRPWGLCWQLRSALWGLQQGRVWTLFLPNCKASMVTGWSLGNPGSPLEKQIPSAEPALCVLELCGCRDRARLFPS